MIQLINGLEGAAHHCAVPRNGRSGQLNLSLQGPLGNLPHPGFERLARHVHDAHLLLASFVEDQVPAEFGPHPLRRSQQQPNWPLGRAFVVPAQVDALLLILWQLLAPIRSLPSLRNRAVACSPVLPNDESHLLLQLRAFH